MSNIDIPLRRVDPVRDESVTRQIDSLGLYPSPSQIVRDNREKAHLASPGCRDTIFHHPNTVGSDQFILDLARDGVSGFTLWDDHTVAYSHGLPLACRDFNFVRCKNRQWNMGSGGSGMFQPFIQDEDDVILPLLGKIYVNGEDISSDPEKMRKMGMEFVKGDDGADATHPGFCTGGRNMLFPGKFEVPGFKTREGGLLPIPLEQLRDIADRKIVGGINEFEAALDRVLRETHTRDDHGLSYDNYKKREFENALFKSVIDSLNQGGNEVANIVEGIAVQLKGVGLMRYTYHLNKSHDDGSVELQDGDIVVKPTDAREQANLDRRGVVLAQRPGYDGESGMFLDILHEFFDKSPTGCIYSEEKGIERDIALWSSGAEMSGITLGYIPFLSKVQVDEACGKPTRMVCEQTVMAVRVILDHTLRLNHLSKENPGGGPSPEFKEFIANENHMASNGDITDYTEEGRDRYLSQLNKTVGKNLNICFEEELTVMNRQNTGENMSVYGRIIDSQSFIDVKSRYQGRSLAALWLRDLGRVAKSSGMTTEEYYNSKYFEEFTVSMLGEEQGKQAVERIRNPKGYYQDFNYNTRASLELCKIHEMMKMRKEGKMIDPKYILDRLQRDDDFMTMSNLKMFGEQHTDSIIQLLSRGENVMLHVPDPQTDKLAQVGIRYSEFMQSLEAKLVEHELLQDEPLMEYGLDQAKRPEREKIPLVDISSEES